MADDQVFPPPRIVKATGAAVAATFSGDWESAERQEKAMSDAIMQAHKEGITDPEEIKARMMAAREAALNG